MDQIIPILQNLIVRQKLIPFIGAGFSVNAGLPSTETITLRLCEHFGLGALSEQAELLHLSQYLKITHNGSISPVLELLRSLLNDDHVQLSQPHLLLARLATPIIYTTNFDGLLERTFRHLSIPYRSVVSTADIIQTTGCGEIQIVKFHGSLEDENSLVLTESDYYERLEFVTPIDIKLRADSLGKSILFIGYSFTDFNMRYLWFKLRRMMHGVDASDVPDSYILLFDPDVFTTTLLKNLGITTVNLSLADGSTRTEKLASFLAALFPEKEL